MRTRSIGHACLEIETSGLRILSDPWWAGPAYTHQWYPWPPPQPGGVETRPVDYLYLSHGHEDHFHVETLRLLRPGATALVPEYLTGNVGTYLREELGFCQVIELRHGRTETLRRGLRATAYVNVTDSILVLEDGDRVLVDANDALHASSPAVIDHLTHLIRRNHPVIDTLFLGFAGASWFPNCVHIPGKHDRNVARAREELFCDNFVRVVDQLRPRIACAFAASFVLVEPHLRWINDVKLELPTPDVAYARKRPGSGTRVHLLLPNDVIDGIDLAAGTTPRPTAAELSRALQGSLRDPVERAEHLRPLSADELRSLAQRLEARVRAAEHRLRGPRPFALEFRLRDNPGVALHVVTGPTGVRTSVGASRRNDAVIELRSEILDALLRQDYGIESIVIGYGAVVSLEKTEDFSRVQSMLGALSPRETRWKTLTRELQKHPLRMAASLWSQRWPLMLTAGTQLGLLPHPYELRNLGATRDEALPRAA
jgi:hypothetical protein